MRNIVCKLIYNNGGEGELVGFDGACDVANIIRNVKKSAQWCSHKKCSCRKFSDKGFKQTLKEEDKTNYGFKRIWLNETYSQSLRPTICKPWQF